MNFQRVTDFWFKESTPDQWWKKDPLFDQEVKKRFLSFYQQAAVAELFEWRKYPEGRLAEILLLDQFPRNMFRDHAQSFATDKLALILAEEAVHSGDDQKLSVEKRAFIYLPYMHSESLKIHEEALRLFAQEGLEGNLDFERKHLEILKRFGRYPHRNKILGRESTLAELEFLKLPGSSF